MHVHSLRMVQPRGILFSLRFATYLFTVTALGILCSLRNIVHSLEGVCNIPVQQQPQTYQRTSIPVYRRLQCELSPDSITAEGAEVNMCAVSSANTPPEMSVAFTNYTLRLSDTSVRCSIFAMTQRISPAAVKGRPCPSIRTTAGNRSSAASSLPTVVIANASHGEAST
jgi:hypothetical protein